MILLYGSRPRSNPAQLWGCVELDSCTGVLGTVDTLCHKCGYPPLVFFSLLSHSLFLLPCMNFALLLMVLPVEIFMVLLVLTTVGQLSGALMRCYKLGRLATLWSFRWTLVGLALLCMSDPVQGVNPNVQQDFHSLPGMKVWKGQPFTDFRLTWFAALIVALGTIFQQDWTLLQTARDQDEGSPGNPGMGNGAQLAALAVKSQNRNLRLFHSIMNYIDPRCALYRFVTTRFNGDGRGLYNYIWTYGHRTYTRTQNVKRESKWKDANVSSLKIPIDEDTVFTWKEWCVVEGNKLGKTLVEQRDKFLDGFPSQFDLIVIPERNSMANGGFGSHVHPVNYPNHFPAALVGVAHPDAGMPDMDALCAAFTTSWVDMMNKGAIKAPPSGSLLHTHAESQGESSMMGEFWSFFTQPELYPPQGPVETAYQSVLVDGTPTLLAISRDSINANTICYSCGGRGHVSQVDGIQCSTMQLGITIPKSSLEGTTYPDGITFPVRNRRQSDRPAPRGSTPAPRASARVRFGSPGRTARPATRAGSARSVDSGTAAPTPVAATPAREAEERMSEEEDGAHDVELTVDLGQVEI